MKRKAPTLHEKLAAALLQLHPELREWAKTRTDRDIIGMFECDHYPIPVAEDGTNHPTNLEMRFIHAHKEKTRKIDIPRIAKGKRITKKQEDFRAKILAKAVGCPHKEVGWMSGKMPTRIQSRPLDGTKRSGKRKRMDGTVERR